MRSAAATLIALATIIAGCGLNVQAPDLFLPVTLRELVRYQGVIEIDGPDLPGRPIWEQVNTHWLMLLARRLPGVSVERAVKVMLPPRK